MRQLLGLFLILVLFHDIAAQNVSVDLKIGFPAAETLSGGQSKSFAFSAEAGQFLHLEVDQRGIDVVVTLFDPGNQRIAEVDSPNGSSGTEPIWIILNASGNYRAEVKSLAADAKAGNFQIELKEIRPATSDDEHFIEGSRLFAEGNRIRAARGREAEPDLRLKVEEAARSFERIEKNLKLKASGLSRVGRFYRTRNLKGLALPYFLRAVELFAAVGSANDSLTALADAAVATDNELEAIQRHRTVFETAGRIGDRKVQVSALIEIGASYYRVGDHVQSVETSRKAAELAAEIGDESRVARALDNLGNAYSALGDYRKALTAHQRAIEIYEKSNQPREIPGAVLNIGNVYFGIGNYKLALESYQRALADFEKMRANVGAAFAISNIGSVYLETGEYDKALEQFLKAQTMKTRFLPSDPTSFYNIASVYRGTGKYTEALESTKKALELCAKTGDTDCQTRSLIELSDTYWSLGDYSAALANADEAIELAKKFSYRGHLWSAKTSAANARIGSGKRAEAIALLADAIRIIDDLHGDLTGGAAARAGFLGAKSDPYRMIVDLLVEDGQAALAFEYSERLKAQTLLEVVSSGKLDISKSMTVTEKEAERKLKNELMALNIELSDTEDVQRVAALSAQLDKKRLEFEDFEARLFGSHPELKVHRGGLSPLTAAQTSTLFADPKTAILEFSVGERSSFVFLLTRQAGPVEVRVHEIPLGEKELASKVESFRSALASGDLNFAESSRELFRILLGPLSAELARRTNLIVVPDGPLWDLPVQALIDERGRYVIESKAVSFVPSLAVLREMAKKKKPGTYESGALLAFGNPAIELKARELGEVTLGGRSFDALPDAEKLVKGLAAMYGANRNRVFTGKEATETTVKSKASGFRILQFATHGVLNDVSPLYSYLVLARQAENSAEDGLLEAWEMMGLDLNADLVVLSACETARGRISNGEGVIGMSWALFIAGVPTTVASQWKVESSSTTEVMLEFHRQLLTGKVSKAEALRRASLKVMKMPKYRHPSYWAGWVMVGDGS